MARPNLPQFEPYYDYYKMRTLVDELSRWIDTVESGESGAGGGNGAGGVTVHNNLSGRSAADTHPITAITDLQATLNGKASVASVTALDVRVTENENDLDQARTQRYFLGE